MTETQCKQKHRISWGLWTALVLPLLLVLLFTWAKGNRGLMDFWVFRVLAPAEQLMGRLWSWYPWSGMELWIVLVLAGSVLWLVRALVLVIRQREGRTLVRRLLALAAVWLWIWCGVCWLWNTAYYAASFAQRAGLETAPYSVETLAAVTEQFAQHAAGLSSQVPRDAGGHFATAARDSLENSVGIYENLTREFPCLSMQDNRVKPIFFSKLQSAMGFTGIYFPFTGEANVNVDAPACLTPVTVAHEMAHRRMVAFEQEANFVGIAACTTCDDPVYQYSGYLLGLIQLCNALYPVAPELWYEIAERWFTPELSIDWMDNNNYWAALESPVEEAAEDAYDSFLKSNDQELGIRSYGACVDLLVAYYGG